MNARPKDVYILGTAYCGSTLLGNALNGHSSIAFAGEISRLPVFGVGESWTTCPLCAAKEETCPIWSPDFLERMAEASAGKALELFRQATNAPVVVDGSKHVAWLRQVRALPLPAHAIALVAVRNPFAFVCSVKRRAGFEAWQAANIWRDTIFDILRCLGEFGLPHTIVRYEEFAREPELVLRRVCTLLGLDFDPSMLRFWESPLHALGGNAGAYVWYEGFTKGGQFASTADRLVAESYRQQTFGGWADEKWRGQMLSDEISCVLKTPSLVDMCTLVGYDVSALLN